MKYVQHFLEFQDIYLGTLFFMHSKHQISYFDQLHCRPDAQAFISSLPKANITWKNLDPLAVLKEVGTLFDLGTIFNLFERVDFEFLHNFL